MQQNAWVLLVYIYIKIFLAKSKAQFTFFKLLKCFQFCFIEVNLIQVNVNLSPLLLGATRTRFNFTGIKVKHENSIKLSCTQGINDSIRLLTPAVSNTVMKMKTKSLRFRQ